ncbi:MAG: hypothetical protein K1X88_34560 [Nannocystaceae bacterium]|nr:hypothetical protein [Nannocystaceae bacterium]
MKTPRALSPRCSVSLVLALAGPMLASGCDRGTTLAQGQAPAPVSAASASAATPAASTVATAPPAAAITPRSDAAPQPAVAAPRVTATPSAAAPAAAPAGGPLTVAVHSVDAPQPTGNREEDYWIQYRVWGEFTNTGTEVIEDPSARVLFYDADGKVIGIDSIATAAQADVGDHDAGENVYAEVHFVAPGERVPFFYTRNLAAIQGKVARHELVARPALVADAPPRGVVADSGERFEGEDFSRKRVFTATLRNDGEGPCRSPALVVGFYDGGKLRHVERFDASDDLQRAIARGESIAATGGVFVSGDNAWRERATVQLWADCERPY